MFAFVFIVIFKNSITVLDTTGKWRPSPTTIEVLTELYWRTKVSCHDALMSGTFFIASADALSKKQTMCVSTKHSTTTHLLLLKSFLLDKEVVGGQLVLVCKVVVEVGTDVQQTFYVHVDGEVVVRYALLG